MLLTYHIYIALCALQAGLLAIRAIFPHILKVYLENVRHMLFRVETITPLVTSTQITQTAYNSSQRRRFMHQDQNGNHTSILQLACFLKITKTKKKKKHGLQSRPYSWIKTK